MDSQHTPEAYRARAQQLRREAQAVEDAEQKRVVLFMADNYEQLANEIEADRKKPRAPR